MHTRQWVSVIAVLALTVGSLSQGIKPSEFQELIPNSTRNESILDSAPPFSPEPKFKTSQDSIDGVLDPVLVEAFGFTTSSNLSARTDSGTNTFVELPINSGNNWVGSQAEVNVRNLTSLYVLNGTFDEGIPGPVNNPNGTVASYPFGWIANSTIPDPQRREQTQSVSYEQSGRRYTTVENSGKKVGGPTDLRYDHLAGTSVYWSQIIIPQDTTEFLLSFDFLYLRGPKGPDLQNYSFIVVSVGGQRVWNTSLTALGERGVWYSTGTIPMNLSIVGSAAEFTIGIVVDEDLYVDGRDDNDGDGEQDGPDNAKYMTVWFDDVSFVAATPPGFDQVQLEFSAGSDKIAVTGMSGVGSAELTNESYWKGTALSVGLSSNTSVSFEYDVRLLTHRFTNSSWTRVPTGKEGVLYSTNLHESSSLSLFTYIGYRVEYENLTIRIMFPIDWANATVIDPYGDDVTNQCVIGQDMLEIPTDLLSTQGWWEFRLQAPNYAKSLVIQKLDQTSGQWNAELIYRRSNTTRASISIGTATSTPNPLGLVDVTWVHPNGSVWFDETLSDGIDGQVNSTPYVLGSLNCTAGEYSARVHWQNGTEVAYGEAVFEVHHAAILSPKEPFITTEAGADIISLLNYQDSENGNPLTDPSATITGNWSTTTVTFGPVVVDNWYWWVGNFDTSLVDPGNYLVEVNAVRPFYDNASCTFEIQTTIVHETTLTPDIIPSLLYRNRSYSFIFWYSFLDNTTGVDSAGLTPTGDGFDWITYTELEDGTYNITITPQDYGIYNIQLVFSKIGYQSQNFVLSIQVNKIPLKIELLTEIVLSLSDSTAISINLTEKDTGWSVTGAMMTWILDGPARSRSGQMVETEGIYIALIEPLWAEGNYRLRFTVQKENYELEEEVYIQEFVQWSIAQILVAVVPPFSLVSTALILVVLVQISYSKKKHRKQLEALSIKSRFEDANNIIGVIILHRMSGLPVYSRILKGGFDDAVVSGFISAITQFRSEFAMADKQTFWEIIPMSDIIRVVSTRHLMCALITVSSSSTNQEENMIAFARAVGFSSDDTLADVQLKIISKETKQTFDAYFDEFLDGHLTMKYKRCEIEGLPRKFKRFERTLFTVEPGKSWKLSELIRELMLSRIEEGNAYHLLLEAIDKKLIVPCGLETDISDL